jgi:hypothetical protein
MNSAFLADVNLARRQLSTYETIWTKSYPLPGGVRWLKWFFVWGLLPCMALAPNGWGIVLATAYLLFYLSSLPPLRLNTFEALRAPSRRALYAARLTNALPWVSWLGASAAANFTWAVPWAERPWLSLAVLGFVALVPLLSLGLSGSLVVLLRIPGYHSVLLVIPFLGSLFAALSWWMDPALPGDTPVLLALPLSLGVLAAGLLALQVWALGGLEPARQISLATPQPDKAAAPTGTVWLPVKPGLIGPPLLLRVLGARQKAAGRFLVALLVRVVARARSSPLYLLAMTGVWLFVLGLMGRTVTAAPEMYLTPGFWAWFLIWGALFYSPALTVEEPRRLYLLGVDYQKQMLYRFCVFWTNPLALFTVLLMGCVAVMGPRVDSHPLAIGVGSLGMAAFREGWFGWPGPRAWPRLLPALLATLGLILLALWLTWGDDVGFSAFGLTTAARFFLFAAVAWGLGAYAMIRKLWRFDERTLRRVMALLEMDRPSPEGWSWSGEETRVEREPA